MIESILPLAEPALRASTAEQASEAFHHAMVRRGATYLQTRLYRRPSVPLTSAAHWQAGGFVKRLARKGWEGSAGFDYICFEQNPMVAAIEQGLTRYRFSDFAPHDDPAYSDYWDAFSEARIGEILCATAYGRDRAIASLHLGFEEDAFAPGEAEAIQIAGMMLVERLMTFQDALPPPDGARLSARERDCMAFVAEGKTDWEIAVILGISATTARTHVDAARRKLGAVNRAQAVARFVLGGGLWGRSGSAAASFG